MTASEPGPRYLRAVPDASTPDPTDWVVDDTTPTATPQPHDGDQDDTTDRKTVAVPPTSGVLRWETQVDRDPVIPGWVRSPDQRRAATSWALNSAGYWVAVGIKRAPGCVARIAVRSPIGLARAVAGWAHWAYDLESRPIRLAARDSADTARYIALKRMTRDAVQGRMVLTAVAVVPVAAAAATAIVLWGWTQWLMLGAAVGGCGWLGRRRDRPFIALPPRKRGPLRITREIVQRAFTVAGLCKESDPLELVTDPHRDGVGWRVIVDLPYGGTAATAITRRDKIASGFDVLPEQLFLTPESGRSGSARRLEVWIASVVPSTIPAGKTPLLTADRIDFWRPFPLGLNERGTEVKLTLLWLSMVVSGLPRTGKTWVMRLFALAAALDPHVRILIFDFKPSPNDWMPFKGIAHEFHRGVTHDPATGMNPIKRLRDVLAEQLEEVERRGHVLSTLPAEVCPEGKLTPELARSKRLDMPLILLVVDEVHEAFGDPEYGEEIGDLFGRLSKRGPAVGAILLTGTQKPGGIPGKGGALFNAFRDSCGAKAALRVTSYDVSEMSLGRGTRAATGMDASRLPVGSEGTILLNGTSADVDLAGGMVRTYLADTIDAGKIMARARALRIEAGTLTGMAVGESIESDREPTRSVIADLLVVIGSAERMHCDRLAAGLAEQWPDTYNGWGASQIAPAVKPWSISPGQVWAETADGGSTNRQGLTRADLIAATGKALAKRGRASKPQVTRP